jgi:hypothetical protein
MTSDPLATPEMEVSEVSSENFDAGITKIKAFIERERCPEHVTGRPEVRDFMDDEVLYRRPPHELCQQFRVAGFTVRDLRAFNGHPS